MRFMITVRASYIDALRSYSTQISKENAALKAENARLTNLLSRQKLPALELSDSANKTEGA